MSRRTKITKERRRKRRRRIIRNRIICMFVLLSLTVLYAGCAIYS